ncbi:MAG: ribosomal 40S subunit protein S13 [Watsoniomyces obsoletus]|nr:MAG: ribosomal 40S subunit protein S13 [Watsoniomyces obsoletus]
MSQNNSTITERACPAPFLPASNYPDTGGFVVGRFCAPFPSAGGEPFDCCLPCPHTDWVYQDNFLALTRAVNYINVVGMACCVFLLLSFAVLPTNQTQRHYLSVCVVLAIVLMNLGFIIPLGAKPKLCYNDITPHDMHSDTTCALSGASLLAGGWYAVMWVFMRALSLHLQICWQVITGRKFFVAAQLAGWGIPAAFVAASLVVTGVSYRFGDTCHIKHHKGLEIFWVPLLTCGAAAIIVQFATYVLDGMRSIGGSV